jgi:hypothetical protein
MMMMMIIWNYINKIDKILDKEIPAVVDNGELNIIKKTKKKTE